jgi:hypothetical protein
MICNYCHQHINEGGRFCEHCGKAIEYGSVSDQQTQKSMLPLAIVIFLNVLFEWINIFYSYFAPYKIRSRFNSVILILAVGIVKVILYLMYIRSFKARIWEKVIFYIIIFLNSLLILAYTIIFLQLHDASYFLTMLASTQLLVTVNKFFLLLADVFLIIFFSFRLKNNRLLWLMVTGYIFYIVTIYSANLFGYYLYRIVGEPTLVRIMSILYIESGSFLMLVFAGVTIIRLRYNKRMDLNKIRNV